MRYVGFIIILFFYIEVSAQETKQYSFKHFSVTNGLASNTVNAVIQDKDGFIWIATVNGLQRYDGSSFISFKSKASDPATIPTNHIVTLFEDKTKKLWLVGDNNKIGIFDTKKFTFKEVTIPPEQRKFYIPQNFIESPSGDFLLLKDDGNLLRYIEKENRFISAPDVFPGPKNWKRHAITWDSSIKKYWMSCDSGLVLYDPGTKNISYRGNNVENDPVISSFGSIDRPSHVFIDKKGNVIFNQWAYNAGGPTIYRYNREKGKGEKLYLGYNGYHEILGWLQQRNGKLWTFGHPFFAEWTDEESISPFKQIPNEFKNEQSLEFEYIYNTYEDKENNIWLATDNGLFLFNPDAQIFTTYNIVKYDGKTVTQAAVQAMAEMSDGKIFVGCWGGPGLSSYDRNFNPVPLPSVFPAVEHSVWDMAINPKSKELWITLQGGGIVVYNEKKNSYIKVFPEIFGKSTIRQVDEDTSGNLWFGTQNGKVIKWDYKNSGNDPNKGYELIHQTGMVLKIHYDYSGYIWIGSLGFGLTKIDVRTNKIVRKFSTSGKEGERLFTDSPGDMTYYNDSILIVTAGCINIVNTKTNKISFINTEDGMPSNTTQSVERDNNGILWIGMTNGICRLNLEKKLITYYDRRDGIVYDKFLHAGVKELSDGRLVFFTDHNFLVFEPSKFGHQKLTPNPQITSFKLAGNSLSVDSLQQAKRVVLKYNNTSIAINFSALSYLQQQKMHYYYMLEGLDKDWIRTDRPVEVIYNYLPPGKYVFKVKSENADGISNKDIATLPITVGEPVWKTWWFYSLIALLALAILYLVDRERMNKRRSMQQMRSQIGLNLHDEVSTALSNINVLSEIAKIKADKNIEQSKEFIDQISDKSRHMMEAMDDMLWSIDPENDSMKKTMLRIKELTDGLRIAYETEIDLIVDNKVQSLELDMKLRHELFFYYKEAMNFVVQSVRCKQIFVSFNKTGSKLLIEILSECHNDSDQSNAFKKTMSKRVKALSATLDISCDTRSFAAALYVEVKR